MIIFRLIFLFCIFGNCLAVRAGELQVKLYNAPSQGRLVFQIYDSADTFGDFRSPVQEFGYPANDDGSYVIPDVAEGTIALLVYHDENGNGRLDRNFIGIPRERVGISNGYRPKGPPNFELAGITIDAMESRRLEIEMFRVLGDRGQIGIGIGLIAQTDPYLDSVGFTVQPIPAISYLGERLQVFGPNLQLGIYSSGAIRIALAATYRIASYKEDDSPSLAGLGNRKSTLMTGLSMVYEWQNGVELGGSYQHDVLGRIGGGVAELSLSRGFQFDFMRLNPEISVNWMSDRMANHDFGVPPVAATADRTAYDTGSTLIPGVGMSSFMELSRNWQLIVNLKVELLPGTITNSPIVDEDVIISGNAILAYSFL